MCNLSAIRDEELRVATGSEQGPRSRFSSAIPALTTPTSMPRCPEISAGAVPTREFAARFIAPLNCSRRMGSQPAAQSDLRYGSQPVVFVETLLRRHAESRQQVHLNQKTDYPIWGIYACSNFNGRRIATTNSAKHNP
jgi:hypothetical protein